MVRVGNFYARTNRAGGQIDFIAYIGDAAVEFAVRIGFDCDLGAITQAQSRQIVLKDIGDDPHPPEIDYLKRRGTPTIDHCPNPQISLNQRSGDWRDQWKFRQGMAVGGPLNGT